MVTNYIINRKESRSQKCPAVLPKGFGRKEGKNYNLEILNWFERNQLDQRFSNDLGKTFEKCQGESGRLCCRNNSGSKLSFFMSLLGLAWVGSLKVVILI